MKITGKAHSASGEATNPSAVITAKIATPDKLALAAAHSHSPSMTSSSATGAFMMASQVFCMCMRENDEYSASKEAAFMVDPHTVPLARNAMYDTPATWGRRLPSP